MFDTLRDVYGCRAQKRMFVATLCFLKFWHCMCNRLYDNLILLTANQTRKSEVRRQMILKRRG